MGRKDSKKTKEKCRRDLPLKATLVISCFLKYKNMYRNRDGLELQLTESAHRGEGQKYSFTNSLMWRSLQPFKGSTHAPHIITVRFPSNSLKVTRSHITLVSPLKHRNIGKAKQIHKKAVKTFFSSFFCHKYHSWTNCRDRRNFKVSTTVFLHFSPCPRFRNILVAAKGRVARLSSRESGSDDGGAEALETPLGAGVGRLVVHAQRLQLLWAQLVVGLPVLPVEGLCTAR